MKTSTESLQRVSLGLGLSEGSAFREAAGAARARAQRPFAVCEAMGAADVVASDRLLPRDLMRVGVCADLLTMNFHAPTASARCRQRLGIGVKEARALLALWEAMLPSLRFELVQASVRIILVRRIREDA